MFAEVFRAVVGRSLPGRSAVLEGFVRRRVRGTVYPGILPGPGRVAGIVYAGLSPEDWVRLDRFEGKEYTRKLVVVSVAGSPDPVPCFTYVYRPERAERLEGDWSPEGWDLRVLKAFAERRRRGG